MPVFIFHLLTISILLAFLPTHSLLTSYTLSSFLLRCRELVERDGVDVTHADNEGITVLHWAAINNRIPVASYIIQKGADVNAVGGELRSTPIHWATRWGCKDERRWGVRDQGVVDFKRYCVYSPRQGHLTMVVLLLRYGGNPELLDAEGKPCHGAILLSD